MSQLSCLTISLSSIRKNYQSLQKLLGKRSKLSSVVKSNAYGLGAAQVAKVLFESGCREFYVDTCDEGLELRKILDNSNDIFVFKGIFSGEEDLAEKYNLIPVLNNEMQIELWKSYAKKRQKSLPCCLHIDTGMTRLGIEYDSADKAIISIEQSSLLEVKYILSHLACADDVKSTMNDEQLKKFKLFSEKHSSYKYSFANSAGVFLSKEMHFDQVRSGICLYGGVVGLASHDIIKPVVSLTTKIINIYDIKESTTVGYSATYRTKPKQKIATISLGYFDGTLHQLGNKGFCCINGINVPYIGVVSMGLTSIDISSVPDQNCKIGQEVEIIGKNISLETIAKLADTINYEVLTSLRNISYRKYV